jgi:hypothetical protein
MAETLMADLDNPTIAIRKLTERIAHLNGEVDIIKDRIEIMEHELSVLKNGGNCKCKAE